MKMNKEKIGVYQEKSFWIQQRYGYLIIFPIHLCNFTSKSDRNRGSMAYRKAVGKVKAVRQLCSLANANSGSNDHI
jgi:hypothetical protein